MRRILIAAALAATSANSAAPAGEEVYKQACARCHDSSGGRIPARFLLGLMTREGIVQSLTSGVMASQGRALSIDARVAVAAYLTTRTEKDDARFLRSGQCPDKLAQYPKPGPSWNRWGRDGNNSRFQPAAEAGIAAADVPALELAWAVGLPGESSARSQPAVNGGRLFVGSSAGAVLALDAGTGCRYWSFAADYPIRGGVIVGASVHFGDARTNVYALDPRTGALVWRTRIGEHQSAVSTGTPQLHDGVLYMGVSSAEEVTARDPSYECCTFRGSVAALDAATGKLLWRTYTVPEPGPVRKNKAGTQLHGPSGAGVWTTPTVDAKRGLIYAATGDNFSDPTTATSDAILALEMTTGRLAWSRQVTANDAYNNSCNSPGKVNCPEANGPDHDFGQPPILVRLAGNRRALVIGQKSGMVHALDPDNQGEILWRKRVAEGGVLGGIQWGSASDGEKMYVAIGDIRFTGARPGGGLIADPRKGGGLAALRLDTGERVWTAPPPVCGDRPGCSPAQPAAVTAIPGVVFAGSLDGRIRGYSSAAGEVIWEFDTAREFDTVNGAKARGGSIDGHGPVAVGGFLYTASGFGNWGGMAGNVLLAFRVRGK